MPGAPGPRAGRRPSSRGVVPCGLLASQKSLEFEKPRYDESRSLLCSGPASSLRVNIRAE